MKKVFLSLGFSGRTKEEIMNDIEKAKEIIIKYNPDEEIEFIHNYDYESDNRLECLGEAIKKMSTCSEVYFIGYWDKYRGCKAEFYICELYNIPRFDISLECKMTRPLQENL